MLQIVHLHFVCVGTVSHKLSSLSLYDCSHDLSGPTTRDSGVVVE